MHRHTNRHSNIFTMAFQNMSGNNWLSVAFLCCAFSKFICCANVIDVNCTSICKQVEMAYESDNMQCNVDCRSNNCKTGCTHWRQSSNSSCQEICNQSSGWRGGKNIGCTLGCVFATQSFMDNAKDLIGDEDAPQLIGGTITSSNVGLRWVGTNEIPDIRYLVQFRKGAGSGEWHYYQPEHLLSETQIYVKDLRPFTKYQFRVAWIIVPNQPPLLSASSPWISTLPSGSPQTAPRNVRAVPLDWHRIEVSWDHPFFPGGNLISYTIYLLERNGDSEVRKDVDANADKRFIVTGLLPNTTYALRLSATNHNGEGPSAELQVTTYPKATVIDDGRGYILLSSGSGLLELSPDIMEQPKYLFNTSTGKDIAGLAVHIHLKFIYISDANGSIYQIHRKLNTKISHRILLPSEELGGKAFSLSTDWLFGFLYFTLFVDNFHPMDWQIWRCDLMGNHLKLVVRGLPYQPLHLTADSYNGYLWWISDDIESGIHRFPLNYAMDSAESVTSTVIYRDKHLGAFTIDAPNFRVLVADQINNTVLAVSLDGTSVSDLRSNTQQAFFYNVTSLALLSGKFFWTSGKEVYAEELNEGTFYHNSFALLGSGVFTHLIAMHRSAQPIPVPLNPPQLIQALFTRTSATITWASPQLPALTGNGAWQRWKYEVHVQEGQKIIHNSNLNSTELVVTNLLPSTLYVIKVRAYSKSGEGPWGTVFKGQTLSYSKNDSRLLWITEDDFISTDIDGKNSLVISIADLTMKKMLLTDITHVTYFRESLIISLLNKPCHLVNLTSGETKQLAGMSGVYSTSVDWATDRIFGVHPKNNTIVWSHLDGSSFGILDVLTVGFHLEIDSLRGLLYWKTKYGVFKSTLTGRNVSEIHQENIFSGRIVYGLALDANSSTVWWVIRDELGCHLYRYNIDHKSDKMHPVLLPHTVKEDSLNYVSERLVWLTDEGEFIIYDPTYLSTSVVRSKSLNAKHIAVKFVPPFLLDNESESLLPGEINPVTVQTKGTWKNFSIVWEPLNKPSLRRLRQNLTIGNQAKDDLHYEISILGVKERASYVISENNVSLPWFVDPYSKLLIVIRAVTNWGVGRNTALELRTPSGLPSAPTRLRVYSINKLDETEAVVLRWDLPLEPRGDIEKYKIDISDTSATILEERPPTYVLGSDKLEQEYQLYLNRNLTYNFKVSAFTYLGEGPSSSTQVNPDEQILSTIPSLIMLSSSAVKNVDIDSGFSEVILENTTIDFAALNIVDKTLLWMNDYSDVFKTSLSGYNADTERVLRLSSAGKGFTFDWIGEIIYWLEKDKAGEFWIKSYDANFKSVKTIYHYPANVKEIPRQILVSPVNNVIFALTEREDFGQSVVVHPLSGRNPYDLFDDVTSDQTKNCSCPKRPSLAGEIALDTSSFKETRLYFSLKESSYEGHQKSSILSSDTLGCYCTLVALLRDYGHDNCDTMAVDGSYLYCVESSTSSLLWTRKEGPATIDHFYRRSISDEVHAIIPLNINTQPAPSLKCLFVSRHNEKPVLSISHEASITLNLPTPQQSSSDCGLIALPPWMYLIYYARISNIESVSSCATNIKMCTLVKTQNSSIVIENLEPFTKYVFRVAFETSYNSKFKLPVHPGPPTIYKTRAKAPKGASSISATAISPEEIKVSFKAPAASSFEVHWKSHKAEKGFTPLKSSSGNVPTVAVILKNLNADTRYEIWVRIFSMDDQDMFTDSPRAISVTFSEPPPISLLQQEAQILKIQWIAPLGRHILRHSVEYKEDYEREWGTTQVEHTAPGEKYQYKLGSLKPASSYHFRLVMVYNTTEHNTYVWPKMNFIVFNTSGDVPGAPGQVRIQQTEIGWEARWAEAEPNGNPIITYELQMATLSATDLVDHNITFNTVYNDTDNFWTITSYFEPTLNYVFRSRGINSLGEGIWSNPSNTRSPVGTSMISTVHLPTILGATLPSCLMFFAVVLTCLTLGIRRADKKRRKAKAEALVCQVPHRGRELELSTLPHLPTNNNFISENNILYNMQSFSTEDIDLPRIPQNCITLTKFLGSGAFGEVYEGTVSRLPGTTDTTKVAIKTLRKGSTEHEKFEFLKEAQLMSNFQHDHILRLLAVCTDHDPFYLILELMQGGDLLSYLRANRGIENGFTLLDLLHMCVDVAKGCVYLEEMHFVHRDLAARNCLVSSSHPSQRVVKIGDFGLARDIYKNDYYRKEGEGLLPVRWMSPESLIDGVFTTHSDVWAFGVLLWEIITLGQQPYPARTNLEVLHYVRSGGKPSRPPNCPEDLNTLTQKCWGYNPEMRPTFKECLNVLLVLEETVASLPSLNVHNVQYMGSNRISGLDNLAYALGGDESVVSDSSTLPLRDNSWNNMLQCIPSVPDESNSGASTIPLTVPLETRQQYLQLVNEAPYQSDPQTPLAPAQCEFHSYEIPISRFQSLDNDECSLSTELTSVASTSFQFENPQSLITCCPERSSTLNSFGTRASFNCGFSRNFSSFHTSNSSTIPKESIDFNVPAVVRKNSLPLTFKPPKKWPISSLPSSPRSPSQLSPFLPPNLNSPTTRISFTFPQEVQQSTSTWLPNNDYLQPITNRQWLCSLNETQTATFSGNHIFSCEETLRDDSNAENCILSSDQGFHIESDSTLNRQSSSVFGKCHLNYGTSDDVKLALASGICSSEA